MTPEPVALEASAEGLYPANPTLSPATIRVPANSTVTLTFTNNDANRIVMHNWVLEGVEGAATDNVANGESTQMNFTAPAPGEYAFFCAIGDHRSRGMEGVLTVE